MSLDKCLISVSSLCLTNIAQSSCCEDEVMRCATLHMGGGACLQFPMSSVAPPILAPIITSSTGILPHTEHGGHCVRMLFQVCDLVVGGGRETLPRVLAPSAHITAAQLAVTCGYLRQFLSPLVVAISCGCGHMMYHY